MRIQFALITFTLTILFCGVFSANALLAQVKNRPTPAQNPSESEMQIKQRVQGMQHYATMQQKILEQRLQKAQAMREQGLKQRNDELLKQAEELERRAFEEYTRNIENIDRYSRQHAVPSAQTHPVARHSSPQQPSREKRDLMKPSSGNREAKRGFLRRLFSFQ